MVHSISKGQPSTCSGSVTQIERKKRMFFRIKFSFAAILPPEPKHFHAHIWYTSRHAITMLSTSEDSPRRALSDDIHKIVLHDREVSKAASLGKSSLSKINEWIRELCLKKRNLWRPIWQSQSGALDLLSTSKESPKHALSDDINETCVSHREVSKAASLGKSCLSKINDFDIFHPKKKQLWRLNWQT
jgi:hypothetical protein